MNLKPISECILELFYVKTESGPTLTENVKLFHFREHLARGNKDSSLPSIWNNPKSLFSWLSDSAILKEERKAEMELFICSLKQRRCIQYQRLPEKKQKTGSAQDFKQPEATWALYPPPPQKEEEEEEEKMTSHHIKEKHLSLQGPSSDVTLNRFMFTKC